MSKVSSKIKWAVSFALILITTIAGITTAATVTIDTFNDGIPENHAVNAFSPTTSSATYDNAGILGGERDTFLRWVSGNTDEIFLRIDRFDSNRAAYTAGDGMTGDATITWDGDDNDATTLNATGLNNANLVSSAPTNDALAVSIIFADANTNIRLRAYEDAGNFGTQTIGIPGDIATGEQIDLIYLFSNFTNTGGGEDFSSLGALELFIDGTITAAADVSIDNIEATNAREYGDLPAVYGAPVTDASHVPQGLRLGANVTVETVAASSANADGDDTNGGVDDEDGVRRDANDAWVPGAVVDLFITINGCTGTCRLSGWIDWNNDGDFADTNEQIFNDQAVSNGDNQTFAITVDNSGSYTTGDDAYARFRICPAIGVCNNTTAADVNNGEIEDYLWQFGPTAVTFANFAVSNNNAIWLGVVSTGLMILVSIAVLVYRRYTI